MSFTSFNVFSCTSNLESRISYTGDYSNNACEIILTNVEAEDGGVWVCAVEEFRLGAFAGRRRFAKIEADVRQ